MSIYNLKNDKRGMTLIEMIISLVILSILMTSTMGMITSSMSIFTSTSLAALDKMVGNSIFQTLEASTKYSTHMTISDSPISDSAGTKAFMVNNSATNSDGEDSGLLYFRPDGDSEFINLYDTSFYNGRTVQYKIEKAGNDNRHIRITVTVYRDGEKVYVRDGLIKCVNLGLLKTGVSANEINDSGVAYDSNKKAVNSNQYLYFTVDELLISGGESAWSIEYKLQEYINKYNEILSEYFGKLGFAQTKLNEMNAEATRGKVVELPILRDAQAEATNAIFGDYSNFTPGSTNDARADGENATTYYNLRKYYQEQIYNLLKFSPMTTNNYSTDVPETVAKGNGSGTVRNPYYGVVATKEQLFTGFMLTYYDKNKDGQIVKSEYPHFDNPKSVFAGTMFNNNGYSENMVILARMWENSGENYKTLVTTTEKSINYYEVGQRNTTDTTWVTPNKAGKTFPSSTVQDSYTAANGTGRRAYSIRKTSGGMGVYKYTIDNTKEGEDFLAAITQSTAVSSNANSIYRDVATKLGAIELTTGYVSTKKTNGNGYTNFVLTANSDLKEGWYYYYEVYNNNPSYHFFYLEAPAQYAEFNSGNVAVPKGKTIELNSVNYSIEAASNSYIRYQQIMYITEGNSTNRSTGSEIVSTYKFTRHHYDDYILYSTDWNSWFGQQDKGIINRITGAIAGWIDGGRKIDAVNGVNANKSLGNAGNFSVNSLSLTGKSYTMAWVVYNQNRGTWYYLPTGSSRISSYFSGTSWYSGADTPTALNLDGWGSSSAMISDIETRKLKSSALFGAVNTTGDVLWVAVPSNNVVSEITTEAS